VRLLRLGIMYTDFRQTCMISNVDYFMRMFYMMLLGSDSSKYGRLKTTHGRSMRFGCKFGMNADQVASSMIACPISLLERNYRGHIKIKSLSGILA
jgi:hypothetical protein